MLFGSIDGIRLDRFTPGLVYEVGTTLGNYLLSSGAAIPVDDDSPAHILPIDNQMFGPPPRTSRRHWSTSRPRAVAADRKPRPRKKR
jgi:hypothetical protein